jgi:hypothetical protein
VTDWHALISAARRRGDHLAVIDLARQALEERPDDPRLEYEKTLAYARAGATGEAEANLATLSAAGWLDTIEDAALRVDFAALRARLLKDRAMAATGNQAVALGRNAADAYEAVWRCTGAYFPAINAATLTCVYGEPAKGRRLAEAAIEAAQGAPPGYWRGATIGEAWVLLGDPAQAEAALLDAVAEGVSLDELASTRRQIAWLCGQAGKDDVLGVLPAPDIVTWDAEALTCEPAGLDRVRARPARHPGLPALAYGAIVSPADVAIAEAFSEQGTQTVLVIACERNACVPAFAASFGASWGERLERVLAKAERITEVTLEGDSTEPVVAAMARQQARGLAGMRAAALVTVVRPLLFGSPETAAADTAAWRDGLGRVPRAFVFGDMRGYSRLPEAAHRSFLDCVIGGFADVLSALGDQVEYVETAGDGIFVVLSSVLAALRCCNGLQFAASTERLAAAGLPAYLGLRLAAHVGPVARGVDRVTGRDKFIGKEVIRTARIEAVTPVGQTYVTEQFAATLQAMTPVGYACEYVGWQAMAKGFGRCRMYALRPTPEIMALLR